ncbi:tautomerase family protein [Pantoea sp. YR343]|uniref:tautomerase family protein n=1 Tax=Pantoea sp. YR343 TaxID=1144341 RepID=UPI0002714A2D|nr:tautomerase family protein [Pantoea sp. YR343]KAJ9430787.1 tautomerase family protein [Pantoea sp. YR343]
MPFVRISLLKGKSPEQLRAIADGVHQALVNNYSVPQDDRFQIIEQFEKGMFFYGKNFLDIERSDATVFIHILANRWRSTLMRKSLFKAISDRLFMDAHIRREDVQIFISNNDKHDWSFGNGIASYVPEDIED